MLNTHYSGRMQSAIDKLDEIAPKKFYEIFTSFDFYDVSDINNGLSDEQRAQVPEKNQNRYTQFSNALAQMFKWYLGDSENGLATNNIQEIVDKLDVRSAANAAKTDVIANGLGAFPPLQAVNAAQQVAGSQVAAVMGTSIFDPDLIPPLNFGLNFELPGNIANLYKSGFFQPNWDFLYDFEYKNPKFYFTGSGGLKVGPGIDVGNSSDLFLKKVFNVVSVSKDLTPLGDPVGGISPEDYQTVLKAKKFGVVDSTSSNNPESGLSDSSIKNFSLNDRQMRSTFYKLVNILLWEAINNRKNWVNGHWGALGHNSCPNYVRTAVASYIWDVGFSIEKNKSEESAFISYCLQMGIYYLVGYKYKVKLSGINGLDTRVSEGEIKIVDGIPKNKSIANTYFTWIADIIARTTHGTSGEKIAIEKRKRRIAEANLIYQGLGLPKIEFGQSLSDIDYRHTVAGLKDRGFDKLVRTVIYRYSNEGAPGGMKKTGNYGHQIQEPANFQANIQYSSSVDKTAVSEYTKSLINYLCSLCGVNSVTVTSTARDASEQARIMYNNLEKGNRIDYKFAGQQVVNVYDTNKPKGLDSTTIRSLMENKINEVGPQNVSRHTTNASVVNVIDIAPNSIRPFNKVKDFEQTLLDNVGNDKALSKVLGPSPALGSDPAYHLEIPQTGGTNFVFSNDQLPDIEFSLKNANFTYDSSWLAPLAKDHISTKTDLT